MARTYKEKLLESGVGNYAAELLDEPGLHGSSIVTSKINPLTGGIDLTAGGVKPLVLSSLYQCANPVISPLDTVNNVLAQVTVPGGAMGKNGRLQIRMMWSFQNTANAKTIKVRFGGKMFAYIAGIPSQSAANIAVDIVNCGAETIQIATPINVNATLNHLTQPFQRGVVDTSINQLLTFEVQKAVGTETAVLEAVFVEICK